MYKARSKSAAKDYAMRYAKRAELARGTVHPIRKGCYVEWYNLSADAVMSGLVINHSYGEKTGQHTFTIETETGKVRVMGRKLYPAIITHKQGPESAGQR